MQLDKVSESIHVELVCIGSLLVRYTKSTFIHLLIYLSSTVKVMVIIFCTHWHRAEIINRKKSFRRLWEVTKICSWNICECNLVLLLKNKHSSFIGFFYCWPEKQSLQNHNVTEEVSSVIYDQSPSIFCINLNLF